MIATSGFSFLVAACSTDEGGGSRTSVDPAAARPLVEAICGMARDCCSAAGYPTGPLADCESELLRQSDWLAAIATDRVDLHEPEFSQCVAQYEGFAMSCAFDETAFGPCRLASSGRALEGETCEDASECLRTTGPVACAHQNPSEIGTCTTLVRGVAGQACILTAGEGDYGVTYGSDSIAPPLAYCDTRDGLYCDYGAAGCAPLPGVGATCDFECAAGLGCAGDVCVPLEANGSACGTYSECQSQHCAPSGLCDLRPVANEKLCSGDYN